MLSCLRNVAVLLGLLAGAMPAAADDPAGAGVTDVVVEAAALPELLAGHDAALVLLDCRSRKEYEAGRVEDARWVDTAQLKHLSPATDTPAQREAWAAWFAARGIGADSQVIIYDDGNMTDAARLWFLMQYEGIRRVRVLNGGVPEIKVLLDDGRLSAAAGPVATGPAAQPEETPAPSSAIHRAGSCPVALADKTAVQAAIGRKGTVILDVRTEAEFRGVDQEKNPRHGHLPEAVNLPHARLLTPSAGGPTTQPAAKPRGRLKSPVELRKLFAQVGITSGRRVVVHCQSGGRAALAAMALVRAGYGDVSNYYASFGEWSADPDLPVLGPQPTTAPATGP